MPRRISTRPACKTGLSLLKNFTQRLTKKIAPGKPNSAPVSKTPNEPKSTTPIINFKRALQSSPELVHKKTISSFSGSTLSLKVTPFTCSSLESGQRSPDTSLTSLDNGSTTSVIFEPMRVRKPFSFMLRNTSEVALPLPLRKARSLCENMIQSPPLLPMITLTTPDDEISYALHCPRSLQPDPLRLGVPIRASRNWPHPAGPWLRTSGRAYPHAPTDVLRLSNETFEGFSAARIPPPRLMTHAEREALVVVKEIQVELENAQQALNSHFDKSWVDSFSKNVEDDDIEEAEDDDEEEEEEPSFFNLQANVMGLEKLIKDRHPPLSKKIPQ